jgi:SAM-dependent methyltransferase
MFKRVVNSKNQLTVPKQFVRGALNNKVPAEQSGFELLDLVRKRLGLEDFAGKSILGIGCGTRMAQAILGNEISIGRYVGLDVYREQANFLREHVTDPRFSFHHVDLHNRLYNPEGQMLSMDYRLPIADQGFEFIWLFSVFTHLEPHDADCLLHIMRRYIKPDDRLLFSVLIDNEVSAFDDRDSERPLMFAAYTEYFMRHLVSRNGWHVLASMPPVESPSGFTLIQHHLVCELA